jgi:hypothetical protein
MATKFKGITLSLGGQDYVVPPLNFRSLQDLQARLEQFSGGTDVASIGIVIDSLHGALQRNYPDVTRDQCVDMLDVMQAVMDVSGLKRKDIEATQQADANPSTGLSSTPT